MDWVFSDHSLDLIKLLLSSANQVRGIVSSLHLLSAGDQILQDLMLLGTQLLDDIREQVLDGLGLWIACNDEGV